jgi:hypothetical protein
MNKLALSRVAMMIFLVAAVAIIGFAIRTYLQLHTIDVRACMAALFMLFFAVFSFSYGKRLEAGDCR